MTTPPPPTDPRLHEAVLLILKLVRGRDDPLARKARTWLLQEKLMPNPLRSEHEDP